MLMTLERNLVFFHSRAAAICLLETCIRIGKILSTLGNATAADFDSPSWFVVGLLGLLEVPWSAEP